ncbi:myeloid-derived growth factor-like [Halichondria panicea]|uniref:myeloid-derived growth factor-like n=1 Tax=Halichondria panicea TaxID=6063 RepID=UPI00312BB0E7
MKVAVVCLLFCLIRASAGENEVSSSIDVKPSGQIAHQSIKMENGVTCVFTYAAAGGTNEEWMMNLKKSKKNTYVCVVERPEQASYLFFMSFALSILEHDVISAEAFDNNGPLLQDEEYMITKDLRSATHKDGGFQSNLSKVTVTARKPKSQKHKDL